MINCTRNADGTITIVCDENTADYIWANAWIHHTDPDCNESTQKVCGEIAAALDERNPKPARWPLES